MRKYRNKTWFYAIVSFLVLIATGVVRSESRVTDQWVTHIVYFAAVFFSVRWSELKAHKISLAYAAGLLIPFLIISIMEEFNLLFSLNIFSFLLAMLNGYLFATINSWWKRSAIVLVSTAYCYIAVNILSKPFLHYDAYGTFNGQIDQPAPVSKGFITEGNDTVTLNTLNPEDILVMDLWSTRCGVCFMQFPILESLYDKYKNNKRIIITALNVPLTGDTLGQALVMIKSRNYTFPVSFSYNGLDTALNVYAYPAAIVIHNNRVMYRGSLKSVEKIIEEIL